MKRALITGISGQDGSFLAEWLLDHDYEVFGFSRAETWTRPNNAGHLRDAITLIFGDVANAGDVTAAIGETNPDEIYHLASQSRPSLSWSQGPETLMVNALGSISLFEAVRTCAPTCRVYNASSSEMYGEPLFWPQDESTPFNANNPYAAAKIYAHQMARIYRESYGLYISSGILFNHESERRPRNFLSQKIAYGAACAALGIVNSDHANEASRPIVENGKLALGDLTIARDWGFAGDFVRAMWLMLQEDEPGDFVVGTGILHSLREFCEVAYAYVGRDWRDCVISDPLLVRPLETGRSLANPSKARAQLGWRPIVSFEKMIERMVEAQINKLSQREN